MNEVHMLKDRKGKVVRTKCESTVEPERTTVWWREVTCLDCLGYSQEKR